jgi:hypothetical protein
MKNIFKSKNYPIAFVYAMLVAVLFLFTSCGKENIKPEKPFIITFKYPNSLNAADGFCRYEYFDNQGLKYGTYDTNNKYNVGDTIR